MSRAGTTRQPAGPGRNVRRPRSPRSPRSAASATEPTRTGTRRTSRLFLPQLRDVGFTRRLLVLIGVFAILGLTYANSLRVMLNQQRDLAMATAQVEQRQTQLTELEAQLQRWRDPAYVKSQARTQLGWVMPGETGYRVIGSDGRVVTDDGAGAAITTTSAADQVRWWDRLAGSVEAADVPAER